MSDYTINYEDERFQKVESEKNAALTEHQNTYDSMISNADKYYQDQIDASKEWEKKQTELQNQQTDFAIQEIEQQKEQEEKDYTREQSGAYVDWQTQSKQHGVRAEQIADMGMQNTGYSESSQVSMYNTYQNRVATAREAYGRALQNYNNAITQARLQNSSALAEIAYQALQQQLELSLQGFQYKNQLLLDKANTKLQIESEYNNRYQDVLQQINTENALAEQVRQFNASLAEEQRQFDYYNNRSSGGGGGGYYYSSGGSGGGSGSGSGSYTTTKSNSSSSGMSEVTKASILKSGIGPVSQQGLANAVASGKVTTATDVNGNTIVKKNTTSASPTLSRGTSNNASSSSSNQTTKSVSTYLTGGTSVMSNPYAAILQAQGKK